MIQAVQTMNQNPQKDDAADRRLRVLVWDERQEEQLVAYGGKYLGEALAGLLSNDPGFAVRTAWRDQPDDGLPEDLLDGTDVIVWWSHRVTRGVGDAVAERVVERVMAGRLGLITLHSAHWSKPFVRLMQERTKADALASSAGFPEPEQVELLNGDPYGKAPQPGDPVTPSWERVGRTLRVTLPSCVFPSWRKDGKPSRVSTLLPEHPIAAGLPIEWVIPETEMYSEPFHVPEPDEVIFREDWEAGEHFRSGCLWKVGKGQVFYFAPGHETHPIFLQPEPVRVVANAIRYLAPKPLSAIPKGTLEI